MEKLFGQRKVTNSPYRSLRLHDASSSACNNHIRMLSAPFQWETVTPPLNMVDGSNPNSPLSHRRNLTPFESRLPQVLCPHTLPHCVPMEKVVKLLPPSYSRPLSFVSALMPGPGAETIRVRPLQEFGGLIGWVWRRRGCYHNTEVHWYGLNIILNGNHFRSGT
jgi:hypothetical protein